MSRPSVPVRDRLYSRLMPCADPGCDCDGCLLWTGRVDEHGYGRISVNRKPWRVHRAAWTLEKGPIPDGLQLDHVKARGCRHRHCAKVTHLEPVTNLENTLRSANFIAAQVAATHCPQNHPYDEANTYIRPQGWRKCRACAREYNREYNREYMRARRART